MTELQRGHFFIRGRVQGVGFRYSACAEARRIGVTGWVRNLPDGSVETVCEGDSSTVAAYLAWCRSGPFMARVTVVQEAISSASGEFDFFRIA